jgi:hypothetical protein
MVELLQIENSMLNCGPAPRHVSLAIAQCGFFVLVLVFLFLGCAHSNLMQMLKDATCKQRIECGLYHGMQEHSFLTGTKKMGSLFSLAHRECSRENRCQSVRFVVSVAMPLPCAFDIAHRKDGRYL